MPRQESEDDNAAPLQPAFPLQTKAIRNYGACHGKQDAEGTESESDADVERAFNESTGKKCRYNPYLQYTEVKRWSTGADSILEPAQINHEICTLTKNLCSRAA
jgi:hypothetical protein